MAYEDSEPSQAESTPVERSLAGGTLAGGSAAAAGLPPLAVLAATAAGMALPYAEIVAHRVFDEFRADARRRVDDMLASADSELGDIGPARLADLASKSEQTQLLTTMAVDAAARTAWPPRVVALGRVLAAGLIAADQAKIDEQQLALSAMTDMDRPHISLLELLVNHSPNFTVAGSEAVPYARPGTTVSTPWHAGPRSWTTHQITTIGPQLRPVLQGLMGTLVRHGLAVENNEAANALEGALRGFERSGQRRARQIRAGSRLTAGALQPHIPQVPRILQTWSPTELGERVLGFYRLAADSAGDEPGQPT